MYPLISRLVLSCAMLALTACGADYTVEPAGFVQPPAQASLSSQSAVVSDSAAMAEAERTADFEQSFSIEMNRRHAEQVEKEARIADNKRAGVVQSPGCEDTVGHAALECEQLVQQR